MSIDFLLLSKMLLIILILIGFLGICSLPLFIIKKWKLADLFIPLGIIVITAIITAYIIVPLLLILANWIL